MSFLSRLPKIKALAPTYGPSDDRSYHPGGAFYGGLPGLFGTPESAMRLITVQNCVRVRAATFSLLPCHIMEKKGVNRYKAEDFHLYEKLLHQPNSWMTAPEFWGMAEAHICLNGKFICYKMGLEDRPVQEIVPIQPNAIEKIEQNKDYSLTYYIKFKDGTTQPVPQTKIVHFKTLTLDGINGVNPIEYARATIGLGQQSTEFLNRYFSNGLHPGAVVTHPNSLKDPQARVTALNAAYGGLDKSHEVMLLEAGEKIEWPTIKLVDAQYIEQMKMGEAQICGLYRVPLMLIQAGEKETTHASAEQFFLNYSIMGVTPDCRIYESVIRRDLIAPAERKKYYAKFNQDALLRGDFKSRMEGYQMGINCEMFSPNDCLEKEDMNPYPGGDEHRTRTSTIKESDKVKQPDKTGGD